MTYYITFLVGLVAFFKGRRIWPWALASVLFQWWLLIPLLFSRQLPLRFNPDRAIEFFTSRAIKKEMKSIKTPADIL